MRIEGSSRVRRRRWRAALGSCVEPRAGWCARRSLPRSCAVRRRCSMVHAVQCVCSVCPCARASAGVLRITIRAHSVGARAHSYARVGKCANMVWYGSSRRRARTGSRTTTTGGGGGVAGQQSAGLSLCVYIYIYAGPSLPRVSASLVMLQWFSSRLPIFYDKVIMRAGGGAWACVRTSTQRGQ